MKRMFLVLVAIILVFTLVSVALSEVNLPSTTISYISFLKQDLGLPYIDTKALGNGTAVATFANNYASCSFTANKNGVVIKSALAVPNPEKLGSTNVAKWAGRTFIIMELDAGVATNTAFKAHSLGEALWTYIKAGSESPPIYISSAVFQVLHHSNGCALIVATRRY
jgi:hypothetical protein